jgi:hypothetical protein
MVSIRSGPDLSQAVWGNFDLKEAFKVRVVIISSTATNSINDSDTYLPALFYNKLPRLDFIKLLGAI